MTAELAWLPKDEDWDQSVKLAAGASDSGSLWEGLVACANTNIDFAQTAKLDNLAQRLSKAGSLIPPSKPVRLALLGSSTIKHLVPGIRVAGLRRGLWIEVYEAAYGQYLQELMDTASALHAWKPEFVALALDARHLADVSGLRPDEAMKHMRNCWHVAKESLRCTVIQQGVLPVFVDLIGSNEHRMLDSPQGFVRRVNTLLETEADEASVHLLAIDKFAAVEGLRTWHDVALWHRSKQEVHPGVSHLYGDYLVRVVAAQQGRSYKCLVLDLDNTVWGGVIGDDGLQGIVLGQGGAAGEAYVAFQRYALRLKDRGILLAVCSKNDEANARMPFAEHPEMVLKQEDIACFVANWDDKAANLRLIARALNIGIDSLVFADDNPFERNLVRRELPEVAVPELPEDPAYFVDCIAGAGYFESLALSAEDRERARLYQANAEREQLRGSTINIQDYLKSLNMEMTWRPFDDLGMQRIAQLMNKTNQFNLTTTRYGEAEVRSLMNDRSVLTWQVRLKDRFGDNGIISLLIGRLDAENDFEIDTWLMSCRVLGRQVEEACLYLIVEGARRLGAERIRGRYRATSRNGIVRDLYPRLGFRKVDSGDADRAAESTEWLLDVGGFTPQPYAITISEEAKATVG